jgi:hypothetical protein
MSRMLLACRSSLPSRAFLTRSLSSRSSLLLTGTILLAALLCFSFSWASQVC